MNTRMDLYKTSVAALLTVALNGCSAGGGPGATALDIGGAVASAAGGLAGAVIPVPFAHVPFDLLAGGMQMAANYTREAARDEESEQAKKAPANSASGQLPAQLIGQISSSGNLHTGDAAVSCDVTEPVVFGSSAPQNLPCRGVY